MILTAWANFAHVTVLGPGLILLLALLFLAITENAGLGEGFYFIFVPSGYDESSYDGQNRWATLIAKKSVTNVGGHGLLFIELWMIRTISVISLKENQ